MTNVKVVDASALAAILFNEAEADAMAQRMHGAALVAPRLLSFELANICLKKCRRDPGRREALIAGMRNADDRGIEELPVDRDAALALAFDTGLTAYDASYLWLAIELDAELVTLDDALARAWAKRTGRV